MTTGKPTPTIAQWIALLDFRDRYGRTWKDALWTKWGNGQDHYEPHAADLHSVRNHADFGPSWLHGLKPDLLQRQRERFTLTLAHRDDNTVRAEQEAVASALANDDGHKWADMTPEAQAPYTRKATLAMLALSNLRYQREQGR
ncbi:hypothetical protein ACH0CP_18710 [Sphingomonas sp. 179-I 2A4 NHS]|uniref:hypothetical protein n=1 Tax=unclassified Sphingomonas TaxID=196159 RepID=UPI0038798039